MASLPPMIVRGKSEHRTWLLPFVDDAVRHAGSGTELSSLRTELRLLPLEPIGLKTIRVECSRHCYAITRGSQVSGSRNWQRLISFRVGLRLWGRLCFV